MNVRELTPEELREIEERAGKATGGKWREHYDYRDGRRSNDNQVCVVAAGHRVLTDAPGGTYPSADLEFIAHARTDVPRLAAAYRALARELVTEHGCILCGDWLIYHRADCLLHGWKP